MKPLTLRHNFSWTFVGNAVYAACQWGMLVVLAKLGSPTMVGQFTLGLAITAPVLMFTNMQLRVAQTTDAKHKYCFSDYLGLRLLSTAIALVIVIGITFFANYKTETTTIILLLGLAKALESISDVFYGLIQKNERMDRIALSLMIKGPLSLVLLSLGVWLTKSVYGGVIGLVIAWAVVLLGYDLRNGFSILHQAPDQFADPLTAETHQRIKPTWHWPALKSLVLLCLPLGFVMLLLSLYSNIPRYFIEHYLGERELGIFAAISYLMVVGNMVINALGESASPKLAKYYAESNHAAFQSLLTKMIGIAAVIGGVAILAAATAGREILSIIYQPEYGQRADLFVWLMIAAALGYVASFLGYGMTAARYFRIQIPLFSLVTGISALVCLWLLPTMGLMGAALALAVSALTQIVVSLGVIIYALYGSRPKAGNSCL